MYKLIKSVLFLFNPETAHRIVLRLLVIARYIPFLNRILRSLYKVKDKKGNLKRELFGLTFENPVGLAAGFDKNGEYYNDLANLGFGFIEIGSLTPEAQEGNKKPRIFRLPADTAIVNRMGINNKGVKYAVRQIQAKPPKIIIGGNIAKATNSPNENSSKDYERSFSLLYDYVDYFAINVSCPNVKNLADLQDITYLSDIIDNLLTIRRYSDDYKPILLKISPDIPYSNLDEIIDLSLISGLDGIIATNTTNSREGLKTSSERVEQIAEGGLSGAPLFEKTLSIIRYIHKKSNGILPIIGVGGIITPVQAKRMLDAGASLIEIYTGFIYEGPGIVKRILKYLRDNS